MKRCPLCGKEYEAETTCPLCNVLLIDTESNRAVGDTGGKGKKRRIRQQPAEQSAGQAAETQTEQTGKPAAGASPAYSSGGQTTYGGRRWMIPAIVAAAAVLAVVVVVGIKLLRQDPETAGQEYAAAGTAEQEAEEEEQKETKKEEAQAEDDETSDAEAVEESGTEQEETSTTRTPISLPVSASSTLPDDAGGYTYDAANVSDWNTSTCWCEGAAGNGVGEALVFTSGSPVSAKGIAVLAGYTKSGKTFQENSVPVKLYVTLDDAGSYTVNLGADYSVDISDPLSGMFYFDFGKTETFQNATVQIIEVRDGTRYQDTCITEMYFYQ